MDILTLLVNGMMTAVGLILLALARWALGKMITLHKEIMEQLAEHSKRLTALELGQAETRGYLRAVNGRAKEADG